MVEKRAADSAHNNIRKIPIGLERMARLAAKRKRNARGPAAEDKRGDPSITDSAKDSAVNLQNKNLSAMNKSGSASEGLSAEPGYPNYSADFQDEVHLFVSAAQGVPEQASSVQAGRESDALRSFRKAAMERYEKEIRQSFQEEDYDTASERLHNRFRNEYIFIHLMGTVIQLNEAALRENRIGVFSLCKNVRDWMSSSVIGDRDYFRKTNRENVRAYLDAEPRFVALSQLVSLPILPIDQGAQAAKPRAVGLIHDIRKKILDERSQGK